jgi:D-threo-aldose 1-dehydrogenase
LYGFGAAERQLRDVLRANHTLTVTSKVGLFAPGGSDQYEAAMLARKVAGRLYRRLSSPVVDFSIRSAARALESSLRRLGRDCIDLYLLHCPQPALVATEEWLDWLNTITRAGKIRHYGLALESNNPGFVLSSLQGLDQVIQIRDALNFPALDLQDVLKRPLQVTFGYISSALAVNRHASPAKVIQHALSRNRTGTVVVSTRRPERVRQLAVAAQYAHDE